MGKGTGAKDRKLTFCPSLEDWSVPELVQECPDCNAFVLYCCACSNIEGRALPCHHYRIIFTDGACTNNGQPDAKAGAGVAYSTELDTSGHLVVPITDEEDDFPIRSNQRAELLAARLGVEYLAEMKRLNTSEPSKVPDAKARDDDPTTWIVATDSEYVVKGITEWLPKWKVFLNPVVNKNKEAESLTSESSETIGAPSKEPLLLT